MGRPRKNPLVENSTEPPMIDSTSMVMTEKTMVDKPVSTSQDDLIAVMQSQIKELTNLVKAKEGKPSQPALVAKKIAKMMFIENNPVIEFGKVRDVGNSMSIKMIVQDEEGIQKPVEMDYLEAMNHNRRYMCEVVKLEKEEKPTHQGPIPMEITTRASDEVNQKTADGRPYSPRKVVLEHTLVTTTAKVKFLEGPWEGKELEVNGECLNP